MHSVTLHVTRQLDAAIKARPILLPHTPRLELSFSNKGEIGHFMYIP